MTPLDLAAAVIICATQLGCCYLLADRWYAHKARAEQRMAEHVKHTLHSVQEMTQDMVRKAGEHVQAHLDRARADHEATQAKVAEHERLMQGRGWRS